MSQVFELRLARLLDEMESRDLDTFLVAVPENRYYLSGFYAEDGGTQESSGYLIINKNKNILLTDGRFEIQAKTEARRFEVVIYQANFYETLVDILCGYGARNIGFESQYISYFTYEKIHKLLRGENRATSLIPVENLIEKLRMIKDHFEISAIKRSLNLTENVLETFLPQIRKGRTEREIALLLEMKIREAGAEDVAFDPIIASGPNGALPHARPTGRTLSDGDAVVVDIGARLDHYCSDMSRTFFIGEVPWEIRKIYKVVKEAQRVAMDVIKPGKIGKEIDNIARTYITEEGYGEYFVHGLGHGVGLSVHEQPGLNRKGETELKTGMIVTIEPGIYLQNIGGVRLEYMVLVTESGCTVLNSKKMYYDIV